MKEEIRVLKEILDNNDLDNYTIDDDECYLNGYARKCLKKVLEEIERLNNIINELEKWLWEERYNHQGEYVFTGKRKIEDIYTMILDKLKELKENSK